MSCTQSWAITATILGTGLVLFVPGLVYAWYALEYLIGNPDYYPRV